MVNELGEHKVADGDTFKETFGGLTIGTRMDELPVHVLAEPITLKLLATLGVTVIELPINPLLHV